MAGNRTPEFGVQCQAAMLRLGTNQKEVAKELGVARSTLNAVIKGKSWNPTLADALRAYLGLKFPYTTGTAIEIEGTNEA